jgi:hypothetical protein
MGKAGEKQKRRPKLTDKKQSERFKQTAREVGADESVEKFDEMFRKIVLAKRKRK